MKKSGNSKPKTKKSEQPAQEVESLPAEPLPESEPVEGAILEPMVEALLEPVEGAVEEGSDLETLQAELDNAKSQADEYLDGWQRARAEFANYKKRVEREQAEARDRVAGDTLIRYLGVLDDLERALKDRPSEGDAAAWAEGIELISRKLSALFIAEGMEAIEAEGATFDPALHEALSHEDSEDHGDGQVIEVVRRGYRMGDRVLRPALVRVAK